MTTPITSLKTLRETAHSSMKGLSDVELVKAYSDFIGADFQKTALHFGLDTGVGGGSFTTGVAQGTDQLQGMLYGAGSAVTDAMGFEGRSNLIQ